MVSILTFPLLRTPQDARSALKTIHRSYTLPYLSLRSTVAFMLWPCAKPTRRTSQPSFRLPCLSWIYARHQDPLPTSALRAAPDRAVTPNDAVHFRQDQAVDFNPALITVNVNFCFPLPLAPLAALTLHLLLASFPTTFSKNATLLPTCWLWDHPDSKFCFMSPPSEPISATSRQLRIPSSPRTVSACSPRANDRCYPENHLFLPSLSSVEAA